MATATIPSPYPIVYSIYALLDPRTESIYYVGQTTDLENRFYAHLAAKGGSRKPTPVERYNKELRKAGVRPELIVLDTIETYYPELALRLEECYRVYLLKDNEPLANSWKTGFCVDTDNPMAEAEFVKSYAMATPEQMLELAEVDKQRALRKVWG